VFLDIPTSFARASWESLFLSGFREDDSSGSGICPLLDCPAKLENTEGHPDYGKQ
jgi:hypothetical protein